MDYICGELFNLFVTRLLFFSLLFFSGPPVIVGMSINIASIDSISEVNMVCIKKKARKEFSSFLALKLACSITAQLVGAKEELQP